MSNVEILTEKLKQEINDLGDSLYPMVPLDKLTQLSDHIKANTILIYQMVIRKS